MSLDDIFAKIVRYKNYICPNGGVTVTGGEPLLQAKFIAELFKKLKAEGIHTCVDTSGIVALTDDVKDALSFTDLVLLDIKHIDEQKCKELVGFSNKLELEFARYLSDNDIPIWIRQVLIPGITDNEADLLKLREFVDSLKSVQRWSFFLIIIWVSLSGRSLVLSMSCKVLGLLLMKILRGQKKS